MMFARTIRILLIAANCAALAALVSCGSSQNGPYAPMAEGRRDTVRAQALTQQAAKVMDSEPLKAESMLREALTADLYFGPAHNNLGVVLLRRGELYSAAGEFEWARKLMPGSADPRMNLALTLERAGRTDEALSAYLGALEVDPAHIQSIQALARLQVRSGRTDDQIKGHLEAIAMRGTTPRWRAWAQAQTLKASP
jgi:Flp pilus assembly protein TadD